MNAAKLAMKALPRKNVNLKFRPELMALDFEDAKTRRILGGCMIDVLSDNIIMIKGLRGKKVLAQFDVDIFAAIKKELPLVEFGFFTMEVELYNKFTLMTDINLEPLYPTMVSGKEAYFVRATL